MLTKSLIAFILLLSFTVAGCDKGNDSAKSSENTLTQSITDAEKTVDDNLKSIEQNYQQQDYDEMPEQQQNTTPADK